MRLLDLFCGAGGSAVGYHRAGFDEIVGVDLHPQPRYPFTFVQADALTYPLEGFDAIHASPPCQAYSRAMRHLANPQPMLIDTVRERMNGTPYVIENVPGAPLPSAIVLCGSAFGMRIHRHRLFETSFPMFGTPCQHRGHAMNPHRQDGRDRIYAEFGRQDPEKIWAQEMGVAWMRRHEAREAIPPAYTEWIGTQLLKALRGAGRCSVTSARPISATRRGSGRRQRSDWGSRAAGEAVLMAEWKRCARHGARQPCAECRRIGEVNRDLRALTDDERIAIWLHGVEGWNA